MVYEEALMQELDLAAFNLYATEEHLISTLGKNRIKSEEHDNKKARDSSGEYHCAEKHLGSVYVHLQESAEKYARQKNPVKAEAFSSAAEYAYQFIQAVRQLRYADASQVCLVIDGLRSMRQEVSSEIEGLAQKFYAPQKEKKGK